MLPIFGQSDCLIYRQEAGSGSVATWKVGSAQQNALYTYRKFLLNSSIYDNKFPTFFSEEAELLRNILI